VVELVLADVAPAAAVHGALCFLAAELPMLGTLTFHGYPVLFYPKQLAKRINAPGAIPTDQISLLAETLARRFQSA
jgi:hypothetical protein